MTTSSKKCIDKEFTQIQYRLKELREKICKLMSIFSFISYALLI